MLLVDARGVAPGSYDEYAAGWDGRAHWVDFHGIRRAPAGKGRGASVN
jgi:hypothetical protein